MFAVYSEMYLLLLHRLPCSFIYYIFICYIIYVKQPHRASPCFCTCHQVINKPQTCNYAAKGKVSNEMGKTEGGMKDGSFSNTEFPFFQIF